MLCMSTRSCARANVGQSRRGTLVRAHAWRNMYSLPYKGNVYMLGNVSSSLSSIPRAVYENFSL